MDRLPPEPMFTTAAAYAGGCTASELKWAARSGRVLRLRRGVYAHAGSTDPFLHERAAALAYPDGAVSHASAARVRSYPLVSLPVGLPDLTVAPRSNADRPGVHPYRAGLREHDVVVIDGVRVTSAARTAIDLARHCRLRTSVPVLDYVLHEQLVTADELRDVLDFCRTWPGASRARRAARLCDSRAESPLESISRLAIPRLGLPVPEPQVIILDEYGRQVARSDFYWDEFGVVGEADGRSKYGDYGVFLAEKDRHAGLDHLWLEMTRWWWTRVWSEPALLSQGIRQACERGTARDQAGIPRRWTAVPTPRIHVL